MGQTLTRCILKVYDFAAFSLLRNRALRQVDLRRQLVAIVERNFVKIIVAAVFELDQTFKAVELSVTALLFRNAVT